MPQHLDAIRAPQRYTRADFTALRAWLQRVDPATILRLYYAADDIAERGWDASPDRFIKYLENSRDDLIDRLIDVNPNVAEALKSARLSHSWSAKAIDYLINAADAKTTAPLPGDPVTQWIKPIAASKLKEDGIRTLGDMITTIRMRGRGWYKPIPYLGRGKAARIVAWLRQHEATLGKLPPLEGREPVALFPVEIAPHGTLAPFERMALVGDLDGSRGINRHPLFPLVDARNDYQAVEAYLYKYRGHDKTYRSYQKEIERFLLWCVSERGKALSSVLVGDCEAYKDFLDTIPAHWMGVRRPRRSPHWKPFVGALSQPSKRYAVQVIRGFFDWLSKVRYLAANPWVAVQDPAIEIQILPMRIEKALSSALWEKLTGAGGIIDGLCELSREEVVERFRLRGFAADHAAQLRLVRAMVLLLGESGMRREELAYATRRHLAEHPTVPGIWRLDVLGKRAKWRSVYLTARTIEALKTHWRDRGEDFSFGMTDLPLVSPVIRPPAPHSVAKHGSDSAQKGGQGADRKSAKGFSPDGIYNSIKGWLKRIAGDDRIDLTEQERSALRTAGIHAFRHTFGTLAVADGMPLDVAQRILGHASLNTTTIYVRTEDQRAATEVEKWVARRGGKG